MHVHVTVQDANMSQPSGQEQLMLQLRLKRQTRFVFFDFLLGGG